MHIHMSWAQISTLGTVVFDKGICLWSCEQAESMAAAAADVTSGRKGRKLDENGMNSILESRCKIFGIHTFYFINLSTTKADGDSDSDELEPVQSSNYQFDSLLAQESDFHAIKPLLQQVGFENANSKYYVVAREHWALKSFSLNTWG